MMKNIPLPHFHFVKTMNTQTQKSKSSIDALLKEATAKLEQAKAASAKLGKAKTKADTKISNLLAVVEKLDLQKQKLELEKQKDQLLALGVSDTATFDALLAAAKLGGFKAPTAPVSSPR